MSLTQLLGLTGGFPDPINGIPALRYLLVATALVWAWLASGGRRAPTLIGGALFAWISFGFWTLTFGRPYGLLDIAGPTREAAFAVRAALESDARGFVVGQPFAGGPWARLAALGVPLGWLILLPTLLPFVTLPLSAVVVARFWKSGDAIAAAALWLAFATSDLEALRGWGFVPGLWAHPAASLGVLLLCAALLGAARAGRFGKLLAVLAGLAGLAFCFAPAQPIPSLWLLPHVLLLDPWPWVPLAFLGWRRGLEPGARACVIAGVVLASAATLGASIDLWAGLALYRLGLVLAGTRPLLDIVEYVVRELTRRMPRLAGRPGLGVALLLALILPGSFFAWWNPIRLDPAAHASLEGVPPSLLQTAEWMRTNLPRQAIVAASVEYAPAVAVFGQLQVLRLPRVLKTDDDPRRERVESALFVPKAMGERNARYYGVSHVLLGPGDSRLWGFEGDLHPPVPGRFKLLYTHASGFRVYALERW